MPSLPISSHSTFLPTLLPLPLSSSLFQFPFRPMPLFPPPPLSACSHFSLVFFFSPSVFSLFSLPFSYSTSYLPFHFLSIFPTRVGGSTACFQHCNDSLMTSRTSVGTSICPVITLNIAEQFLETSMLFNGKRWSGFWGWSGDPTVILIRVSGTDLSPYATFQTWSFPVQESVRSWQVLISRLAEGRKLSWPEWLITHQDGIPADVLSTHLSTNQTRYRATYVDVTKALPLNQVTTQKIDSATHTHTPV